MISIIVAMDKNRAIGVNNTLPWHLPADLKRFKALTMGHHMIMGRKTYESIGKPLPGRTTVIVTRQKDYKADGCKVVHSLNAALEAAREDAEIFVIGGAELFTQALARADRLYVTFIDTEVKGDTFFPQIDPQQWITLEEQAFEPDEKNCYHYRYVTFERR